ncbi:MAG: TIGR02206 family membrane protein [Acidobacteriota bacterium]|nr:TIGR02206 family membrane protein [Acidobacteriota bacterium]
MPANFHRFGPAHLVILCTVLLLAAVLAAVQRRLSPGSKWLRVSLGVLLLLDWAAWYGYLAVHGQLTFPDQLPLELCDVTLFLIAIALFNLSPAIFDLAYYGALAGSSMALLTPDLWEPFPSVGTVQFFAAHGLAVTATLYLAWSGLARPRPGSVGRAMLAVNIFAAFDAAFNTIFKTNYMYLCAKPENASLLSFLGPWPWYILTSEGVALVLFLLIYLPFRPSARKRMRLDRDCGRN